MVVSRTPLILFSGPEYHEYHGADADGYAYTHSDSQGLSEQESPYHYCRQRLEHTQDGGLCGADITGGYRQREERNHGRHDCKAD